MKVQTDYFEDLAFHRVISPKPPLSKGLRKFKRFHRYVGSFTTTAIRRLDLESQPGNAVPELRALRHERLGLDLLQQPEIQETILLLPEERQLPLELGYSLPGCPLILTRTGLKDASEPVPDLLVLDPDPVEQGQHLLVKMGLGHTDARMTSSSA